MKYIEINNILSNLKTRANAFKATELYLSSKPLKFDISAIEIALSLTELGINNDRSIEVSEEYWFKGAYLIDNDFNGDWEDISTLYKKLAETVKNHKYFRE